MSGRALDVLTASTTIATFVPDDGSDVVLFDTSTKQLHRLAASAASVWAAIDGRRSISQVREVLGALLGATPADVDAVLDQFRLLHLVESVGR